MNAINKRSCAAMVILAFMLSCITIVPAASAQDDGQLVAASEIMDRDVYDKAGKLIGEVDDIVLRRSGRAKKLIVEYGGFMDIADSLVAVNFKRFSLADQGVKLEATEKQLDERPSFNYYRRGLRPEYYYYSTRPYYPPYPYPPPNYSYEPGSVPQHQRREDMMREWTFSPPRFLASVVLDRYLLDSAGANIGQIEELLIDMENRKIEKIVVWTGGILGDERLTLPYKPLGFTAYGLVYDATTEELGKMVTAE